MSPGGRTALIVGSTLVVLGGGGALVWMIVKGPPAPASGSGAEVTNLVAPSGSVSVGEHLELDVSVQDTGSVSETIACEAVSVDASGNIVDVWFATTHPTNGVLTQAAAQGSWPVAQMDNPLYFQNSAQVSPGATQALTGPRAAGAFGSVFNGYVPGTFRSLLWVGVLPSGYTGPLVKGKYWGRNISGIQSAVSGVAQVPASTTYSVAAGAGLARRRVGVG